jgi:fluoride ion exporter CrcB/FEX
MGFLIQDSKLFRHFQSRASVKDEQLSSASKDAPRDPADEAKAIAETKKLTPLYIGLATGFCGSFTSFSSFIRDAFLAMSNNLPNPDTAAIPHRNGGYSFMALLAVLIVTISSSIAALVAGGHLALLARRITPSLPPRFTMRILDRLVMLLGPGIWLGAVLLSALPPDRSTSTSSPETKTWRGRATFALVFAPLGCLTRFYLALHLNRRLASFPLGTFAANMSGTAVLGMCYDLQHVPLGGVVGCQILEGVQDGFCGCLTTVSTWVAELASLRRGHAYRYGGVSVGVALGLLVVVMGSVQWTRGFEAIQCAT